MAVSAAGAVALGVGGAGQQFVASAGCPSLVATLAAGASAGAGPARSLMEWLGLGSTAHIVVGMFGCVILLIFIATLVAMIPTLRTLDRVAIESEMLLRDVRKEVPATLAALRRSSSEIADLASEVEDIATDLGRGLGGGMHALRVTATLARQTWAGFMTGVKNGMVMRQKFEDLRASRQAKAAVTATVAANGAGPRGTRKAGARALGGGAASRPKPVAVSLGVARGLKSVVSAVSRPLGRRLASLTPGRRGGIALARTAGAGGGGENAASRVRSNIKKMLGLRKKAVLKKARNVQAQIRSPGFGYPTGP